MHNITFININPHICHERQSRLSAYRSYMNGRFAVYRYQAAHMLRTSLLVIVYTNITIDRPYFQHYWCTFNSKMNGLYSRLRMILWNYWLNKCSNKLKLCNIRNNDVLYSVGSVTIQLIGPTRPPHNNCVVFENVRYSTHIFLATVLVTIIPIWTWIGDANLV